MSTTLRRPAPVGKRRIDRLLPRLTGPSGDVCPFASLSSDEICHEGCGDEEDARDVVLRFLDFLHECPDKRVRDPCYVYVETGFTDALVNKYGGRKVVVHVDGGCDAVHGCTVLPSNASAFGGGVVFSGARRRMALDLVDVVGRMGHCVRCDVAHVLDVRWFEVHEIVCCVIRVDTRSLL